MKKAILTIPVLLFALACSGQQLHAPKNNKGLLVHDVIDKSHVVLDSTKYTFTEPDVVLIDNLLGQLDQCAGNSDRISTSQYNAIHHAVLRLDSVIKVQYFKFHPVKEQAKKP